MLKPIFLSFVAILSLQAVENTPDEPIEIPPRTFVYTRLLPLPGVDMGYRIENELVGGAEVAFTAELDLKKGSFDVGFATLPALPLPQARLALKF